MRRSRRLRLGRREVASSQLELLDLFETRLNGDGTRESRVNPQKPRCSEYCSILPFA